MYWSDVGHRAIATAEINDGTSLTVLVNQLQNITTPGTCMESKLANMQHYVWF